MTNPAAAVRVAAVVLAAGGSSRLGHPKQLVLHDGAPLVRRAALAALGAGACPVIVVVGAHAAAVAGALDGVDGLMIVENVAWETGLSSSLAVGLGAVTAVACDAVLVTLADQPLVDAAALRRLLEAFATAPDGVAAATYRGALGVPAVFARAHFDALARLTGDAGAGRWLRDRAGVVGVVGVPLDAAAFDVDTPADAERLRTPDIHLNDRGAIR